MNIKDCLPDGAGTCRNEAMIEELQVLVEGLRQMVEAQTKIAIIDKARVAELEAENARLNVMIDRRDMWLEYAKKWSALWKRKAKEFRDWYFYAEKHIFRSQELSQRVNELEATNARLREALERIASDGTTPAWIRGMADEALEAQP